MNTTIYVFIIATFFAQILAAPFPWEHPLNPQQAEINQPTVRVPNTAFCRLAKEPSRCVDEPLPIEDKEPWCPYRMCAPSYVPADLCPPYKYRNLQATDKCKVEDITRDIYKCDGNAFGHNYVPIGCTPGTLGCYETPTCSCVKIKNYTSKVWTQIAPFKPDCRRGGPRQ